MVEKFETFLSKIEEAKGSVKLLAFLKMDELTDKWSIFVVAEWIDNAKNKDEIFSQLVMILRTVFTPEERTLIARMGLVQKDDYVADLFLRYSTGAIIRNEKINGFDVHEAYIIKSTGLESDANKAQGRLSV